MLAGAGAIRGGSIPELPWPDCVCYRFSIFSNPSPLSQVTWVILLHKHCLLCLPAGEETKSLECPFHEEHEARSEMGYPRVRGYPWRRYAQFRNAPLNDCIGDVYPPALIKRSSGDIHG